MAAAPKRASTNRRSSGNAGPRNSGAARSAAGGGINAKGGKRLPSGGSRGRAIGGGDASGATGGTRANAFGITGRKGMPVKGGVTSAQPLSDHVPSHTFASSTMPRDKSKAPNGKKSKGQVFDPDHDGDNDASPTGDTDHDYVLPNGKPGPAAKKGVKKASDSAARQGVGDPNDSTSDDRNIPKKRGPNGYQDALSNGDKPYNQDQPMQTPHLAEGKGGKKGPLIKPSKVGTFSAKAKAAGFPSALAYANHVMSNKGKFDSGTVAQANFAKNFGGASKARAKS